MLRIITRLKGFLDVRLASGFAKLVFILLPCAGMLGQPQKPLTDLPAKIKGLRPSVVAILVGGTRNGSGFIVSKSGYIMTATHVVGTAVPGEHTLTVNYSPNIEVVLSDGSKYPAVPVPNPDPQSALFDSTLLKINHQTPSYLHLSVKPVEDGAEVYMMGFPLDLPNAVTYTGTIASQYPLQAGTLSGVPIYKKMIQVEAPIAKGFSGSALLNYKTGEVIGIVEIKIGGINDNLEQVARKIQAGQAYGSVTTMGVDTNASLLQLIGVLDAYLSAGSGSAVSVVHINAFVQEKMAGKM